MIAVLEEPFVTVIQPPRSGSILFVSSSLDTWATNQPKGVARDFQINDTVYRRLDPGYYAWLRSRMVVARKAATAGQFAADTFEELRVRFNAVQAWAVEHFGEETLLNAIRQLRVNEYRPPLAEPDSYARPLSVRTSRRRSASAEAAALVDVICGQARALGWKRALLYSAGRHVFGPDRGLVSYLKPGDRIGEVTTQSIEIILSNGVRQRFYNPDVEQPWLKKKN